MRQNLSIIGNEVTRLLCSFAIILVSLIHVSPATSKASFNVETGIVSYEAANGAIVEICSQNGDIDDNNHHNNQHAPHCEFCQLTACFSLAPSGVDVVAVQFNSITTLFFKAAYVLPKATKLSPNAVRGPPIV
ncbi:MAG: DUF2946 family protein [Nitratireductor sp.]